MCQIEFYTIYFLLGTGVTNLGHRTKRSVYDTLRTVVTLTHIFFWNKRMILGLY